MAAHPACYRPLLPLGAITLAVMSTSPAFGQAAPQQVEISGQVQSDTEQRRRDPVAKTIYGRDELDKYGDTSVSDVLKRLPGVNMQGGNPRLRGLGAGYTLLLINGEPAPPGFSLDNLSPGQVERIELTRGPSAEHSAQAVAGTLNIILREAPRQRQRELGLRLGYQAVRPTLAANGQWGDRDGRLSYTLPFALYQWRGQADTFSERQVLDVNGDPQHLRVAGVDQYWGGGFNLGPRLTWKLSDTDSLNLQLFAQRNNFNNRGGFVTEVLQGAAPLSVDDRFVSGGHWQMQRASLQWVQRWADGARLEVKAGGQASRSQFRNLTDGVDGTGMATLARDTTGDNRELSLTTGGKFTRPLGESHTLALGWDAEQRRRREQRSVIENGAQQLIGYDGQPFEAELTRAAVFVQDEWEIAPRWSTYLGLRAERIAITSVGVDDVLRNSSQVITPIWHVNHKLSATGRDLVRASITRSYKAPDLNALMARPSLNSSYPVTGPNPQIGPDRIGNPALKPELATGLDLAFEKYLPQGGVLSIGGFHRRIAGLIRHQVRLQTVPWATVPRWVSQPINLAQARSTGLEVELKGRADELLPAGVAPKGLSLRASASLYRSTVDGLPGPDNRLEQQQPWGATAGFDQVLGTTLGGPPLTVGASLAWTPGYRTQQTADQGLTTARIRTLDAYALWAISRQASLRLSANNLLADGTRSFSKLLPDTGAPQSTLNTRSNHRSFNAGVLVKF
jgi:iron complex outermembrane receptor protein